MTKTQLLARIERVVELQNENMEMAVEQINQLEGLEIQVLAKTVLAVGTSIIDALNNITLLLLETLRKED